MKKLIKHSMGPRDPCLLILTPCGIPSLHTEAGLTALEESAAVKVLLPE